MRVLVTGNAGFIGFHLVRRLLQRGDEVVGVDSVNDYYDVELKEKRLALLQAEADKAGANYSFVRGNLAERGHARKGVRRATRSTGSSISRHRPASATAWKIRTPMSRATSSPSPTCSRRAGMPACSTLPMPAPAASTAPTPACRSARRTASTIRLQFYAATKRANELMAHSYSHLFRLPTTGLRFFTVYGPWGRPDMALFLFTKNILAGEPIQLFNNGNHTRDFTYRRRYRRRRDAGERRISPRPTPTGTATTPIRRPATRRSASSTSATTAR